MKSFRILTLSLSLIPALALQAAADTAAERDKFSVGVGESVLGHTFEAGYRVNDRLGLRGMYGTGSFDFEGDIEGNEFNGAIDLGGAGLFVDFYPFKGALRLSAGALDLGHALNASTMGTTEINGTVYNAPVDIDAEFSKNIAPAVTIGFSKALFRSPVSLNADIGAAYSGSVKVRVTDDSGTIPQSELDAETAEIQDALNEVKVAPFLKFGITYNF